MHYDYRSTHAAMATESVVVPETAIAACGAAGAEEVDAKEEHTTTAAEAGAGAGLRGGCWVSIYVFAYDNINNVDAYAEARFSVLVTTHGTCTHTSRP